MNKSIFITTFILSLQAALAGGFGSSKMIKGEVIIKEKMMIQTGLDLEITLEDISKADAPSEVLSNKKYKTNSQPPYKFELSLPTKSINSKGRYSLRATIKSNGQLVYTSTSTLDPTKEKSEMYTIIVSRVGKITPFSKSKYNLVAMNKKKIDRDEKRQIYIQFKTDTFSGFSGCNNFQGRFKEKGGLLKLGGIGSTKKACITNQINEFELYNLLESVNTYKKSNNQLILVNKSGEEVLTFTLE